jgi:ABC-2 type transport system permease protein
MVALSRRHFNTDHSGDYQTSIGHTTARSQFEVFWRVVLARMGVRITATTQEPLWVATDIIIPLITIAGYIYLYKALGATQLTAFVVIGGVMIAFWANILWNMAAQFYWEKEQGNLEMYFVSPAPKMAVLLGMALGSIINTSMRAGVILVLGAYIFNIHFVIGSPAIALIVFFLALIALYAMGMLFASLFMLYGREAWHTANLLQDPVYFVGGFYFPIFSPLSPLWLQFAASAIPVSFALDGLRDILVLGQSLSPAVERDIIALIIFIIVLLPLAKLALRYMENLGKKHGRLTIRWQ